MAAPDIYAGDIPSDNATLRAPAWWSFLRPRRYGDFSKSPAVGVILMIVGAVGAVLSLIAMALASSGRHRTVVDDGTGNVVQREDTYR